LESGTNLRAIKSLILNKISLLPSSIKERLTFKICMDLKATWNMIGIKWKKYFQPKLEPSESQAKRVKYTPLKNDCGAHSI
jgi:hypothetical protein